jgi:hypothetical protein
LPLPKRNRRFDPLAPTMAPRVFLASQSSNSTKTKVQRHDSHDAPSPVSQSAGPKEIQVPTQTLNGRPMPSEAEQSTLSKPMGIPTSRQDPRSARSDTVRYGQKTEGRRASDVHDPASLPPSVAALLAMTMIPPQRKKALQRSRMNRRAERLEEESGSFESQEKSLMVPSSPLDILLGPLEDSDEESRAERTRMDSTLSLRSTSSESVPSLAGDDESMASVNTPPTPSTRGRTSVARRARLKAEDCAADHPLARPLPSPLQPSTSTISPEALSGNPRIIKSQNSRPAFFKSNLTASIRAFKSAALSISNFANSSIPPDDLLTRSILSSSPQFTDERRPPELPDTPSPAMRRYFNPLVTQPTQHHVSFLHETGREDYCTASIQMQAYRKPSERGSRPRSSGIPRRAGKLSVAPSSRDKGFSAEASCDGGPIARQRESRENGDFLRVICLEMSMRRSGKLSDTAPGRARIALPPRQPGKDYRFDENGVPIRWVGLKPAVTKYETGLKKSMKHG